MTAETGSVRERDALIERVVEIIWPIGEPEGAWPRREGIYTVAERAIDAALAAVADDPGLVEVLAREHGCTRPRYGTEPCRGCRDRADVIRAWLRGRP